MDVHQDFDQSATLLHVVGCFTVMCCWRQTWFCQVGVEFFEGNVAPHTCMSAGEGETWVGSNVILGHAHTHLLYSCNLFMHNNDALQVCFLA